MPSRKPAGNGATGNAVRIDFRAQGAAKAIVCSPGFERSAAPRGNLGRQSAGGRHRRFIGSKIRKVEWRKRNFEPQKTDRKQRFEIRYFLFPILRSKNVDTVARPNGRAFSGLAPVGGGLPGRSHDSASS